MFIPKKKIFITIVFITIIIIIQLLKTEYILVIDDYTHKKSFKYELSDKKFSLGYTHSVMKTEAEEFFIVGEKNSIELVRTEYKSYGVGLPFLPEEGNFKIENGKFILDINRKFKTIPMVISPLGKHYLKINNKKYMLTDILENEPSKIELKIKKIYKF